MNRTLSTATQPRRWRRWLPPAAIAGIGGAGLIIWLEELMILTAELIGVVLIPILAGIIYLFNILVFRSAMPRRGDAEVKNERKE